MLTIDRKKRPGQGPVRARRAEQQYGSQLRRIAKHVGDLIEGFPPGHPESDPQIDHILGRYAEALDGWARSTAARMLSDVNRKDHTAWMALSEQMSAALRDEIRNAPTGVVMQALLDEQVVLIKSLPLDAAKRVHELTLRGIEDGTRAREIAKEILRSGEVSKNRADLIARTEVARTAATLTQARAQHIGSTGYIWRTSGDSDVRHSHKEMNGQFIPWGSPPTLDGMTGHAGCLPNCRCYSEPVIPD